jgi:UDP-2,3-diacylglucosamine pyrophosphatase LpxH
MAVLDPSSIKAVPTFVALAARSFRVRFDEDGIPVDRQNIRSLADQSAKDKECIKLAYELAGFDPRDIGIWRPAKDLLQRLRSAVTTEAKKAVMEAETQSLLKAFRSFAESHERAFDVNTEAVEYLKPANAAATRGFEIVIYGHTHLAKRVKLAKTGTYYFNTGPWADLMKVPEAILSGDKEEAELRLSEFLSDLENGELGRWRCSVPTFARVDMESGRVLSADLYLFDGASNINRLPDGRLPRVERL